MAVDLHELAVHVPVETGVNNNGDGCRTFRNCLFDFVKDATPARQSNGEFLGKSFT